MAQVLGVFETPRHPCIYQQDFAGGAPASLFLMRQETPQH
jgi:hypothetical protein